MIDGYYIYLDQRDVGKGDVLFIGWVNDMPVFSLHEKTTFKHKELADKTVEMILNTHPELEGLLHVEPCEEATFDE